MNFFTLGFVFDQSLQNVLLIHKSRPESQKGRVNGLGGKIEKNETPLQCIVREVKEESNLQTDPTQWIALGSILDKNVWHAYVFAYVYTNVQTDAKSMEDQPVEWFPVDNLPKNSMNNLAWLIPFALDKITHQETKLIEVVY
jgi:8-oxo-dGTP diphosphatase